MIAECAAAELRIRIDGELRRVAAIMTSRSMAVGSTKPSLMSVYSPMKFTRPGARTIHCGDRPYSIANASKRESSRFTERHLS